MPPFCKAKMPLSILGGDGHDWEGHHDEPQRSCPAGGDPECHCPAVKAKGSCQSVGYRCTADQAAAEVPNPPDNYKEIFQQCIRYAEPDVGDYLSKILVLLQIHNSRMKDYVENFEKADRVDPVQHNLLTYLYRLGELQALVSNLFGFARNQESFNDRHLEWEDFRNAYGNLDIWVETFRIDETMNLEDFTKRAILRDGNS